jgi:hypothetical protein
MQAISGGAWQCAAAVNRDSATWQPVYEAIHCVPQVYCRPCIAFCTLCACSTSAELCSLFDCFANALPSVFHVLYQGYCCLVASLPGCTCRPCIYLCALCACSTSAELCCFFDCFANALRSVTHVLCQGCCCLVASLPCTCSAVWQHCGIVRQRMAATAAAAGVLLNSL